MNSGRHWHSPFPLHTAFGPQGDGLHGSVATGLGVAVENEQLVYVIN